MNKVVFFEIPADELERAQHFYKSVFGWGMQPYGEEVALVTTIETDAQQVPVEPGAINGDLYTRTQVGRHPSVVIDVADIEEHIRKIEAAGGKIRQRQSIEGLGLIAAFEDTEGNVLGIWQKQAPAS
jgi:predicted enzyme related to lactoylglutathione lyase